LECPEWIEEAANRQTDFVYMLNAYENLEILVLISISHIELSLSFQEDFNKFGNNNNK
jgi:hypothetical protein